MKLVLDERPPCEDWEPITVAPDESYCSNCGGVRWVHEPWLSKLFDWLESIP